MSSEKLCADCNEVRPLADFHRNGTSKDGLSYYCRSCTALKSREKYRRNKDAILTRNRVWREANRERDLSLKKARYTRNKDEAARLGRINRLKQYGLTESDYQALLESQDGVCAICGIAPTSKCLAVDHDHSTGTVRGLLCGNCNRGIGYLGDNLAVILSAARYLDRALMTGERP